MVPSVEFGLCVGQPAGSGDHGARMLSSTALTSHNSEHRRDSEGGGGVQECEEMLHSVKAAAQAHRAPAGAAA